MLAAPAQRLDVLVLVLALASSLLLRVVAARMPACLPACLCACPPVRRSHAGTSRSRTSRPRCSSWCAPATTRRYVRRCRSACRSVNMNTGSLLVLPLMHPHMGRSFGCPLACFAPAVDVSSGTRPLTALCATRRLTLVVASDACPHPSQLAGRQPDQQGQQHRRQVRRPGTFCPVHSSQSVSSWGRKGCVAAPQRSRACGPAACYSRRVTFLFLLD